MDTTLVEKALYQSKHVEFPAAQLDDSAKLEGNVDVQGVDEITSLSPAQATKVEKRVVIKQDLTIVLLLAVCGFLTYLVSLRALDCNRAAL